MFAASNKKFELAASVRDKLNSIEEIAEKQQITTPDQTDIDVINYIINSNKAFFNLFQIRNGKLINQENFQLFQKEITPIQDEQRLLEVFLQQYYEKATDLPVEILIPHRIEDISSIQNWLSEIKGRRVKIIIPHKGRKNELLNLSYQNAKNFAKLTEIKWQGHLSGEREKALEDLAELIKSEKKLKRIECYDVSHMGGQETVASMVVFKDGFPDKSDYRKFKLRQIIKGKPDDYSSMKEALTRRLKHLNPGLVLSSLKILKATKKDMPVIKKITNQKIISPEEILKIVNRQKIIGSLIVTKTAPKEKKIIDDIKLSDIEDLRLVFKKIAKKMKTKRLYIKANLDQIDIFEKAGLQQVKKIPESLKIKKRKKLMVYNPINDQSDRSFQKKPDLIIVDGGRGQLNVAIKVLESLKLEIPVISIAKRNEELYKPGNAKPIIYPKDHPLIHMIQHIRDESHRFAVSYQQKLKLISGRESALDNIYGIGEKTKIKLLKHFGSPEQIKNATLHELEQVVGKKNALLVKKSIL